MKSTLRAAAAALALSAGLTAAPPPAHAFLGGLLNSFFGGGGGAGCFSEEGDGLFGSALSAVAGVVDAATDAATGSQAGGCPIVESRPLVVEEMVHTQELELIAQTAHMITQIENLVTMRRLADLDTRVEIATRLSSARQAAAMVDRVLWSLPAVDAQFAALYPDALPAAMTAAQLAAFQSEQAGLARAASRASKLVTADTMTGTADYPERTRRILDAVKACEGQTCVLDAGTQASLLSAEIGGQLLMMQAAHYRAVEAQLDYEQAAVERARQHTLIAWRGLDTYGAPGS